MCTATGGSYNANGPSSAGADGTWKPVENMTDEGYRNTYDANLATNQAAYAANGGTMARDGQKRSVGTDNPFAPNMAASKQSSMQRTAQNQQAARDAAHLAAWGAQGGKQARAPGKGSSLITSGASNSVGLAARGTTAGTTLLGG